MRKSIVVAMIAAITYVCAGQSLGQDQHQDHPEKTVNTKKNPYAGPPLMWSVESILDSYVSQMTRYYNLTDDQREYTRQLLTQRVKRFLSQYETDVRSLFTEYWYLQSRGEAPTVEEAKDLARRGGPLISAIKKEILDGNQKWREILDENQRKIHDRDLEQMGKTFDDLQERVERWSKGDVRPTDVGKSGVSRRPRPVPSRTPGSSESIRSSSSTSLDAGQQETARSIMRELREEASRYREEISGQVHRPERQAQGDLRAPKPRPIPKRRRRLQRTSRRSPRRLNTLERPIREDLFKQLLVRLERIPTEDQRRVRKERQERLYLAGGKGPSSRSSSQPDSAGSATTKPMEAAEAK